MEIFGYIAALFIGLSLGLTGSGGSILTVPILVYLMRLNPVISTSYSLFIVGSTSLVGSYKFYLKKLVSFKTALIFGVPSLLTVFLTRSLLVPAIPRHIIDIGGFEVTKGIMLMVMFALLMLAASFSMIFKKSPASQQEDAPQKADANYVALVLQGTLVGLISGLVGAGGGFLIIPALVLFTGLDIKLAVGTSLVIVTANSLLGFVGDILQYNIDWTFLLTFTALSVAGIFIGTALSSKVQGEKLKKGFGWFVLAMGLYILAREIFLS
ncbi:sulfite exporter TauE/SafE family protein [Pontibacter mangrovi]|uniref:Probable membrane transporter protein n=1 Tax=Pontibacter mangrovi TaxID=2589816 RepID=A0A501WBP4_9BACT|nr:sulfite exporter TauE/SafE family protein [Pontibacter mangrovi]TPE46232.1 sulfite exporter TauE/SafE family protein [Pontibacter mangrovi]